MNMRASWVSELRQFSHFHILKLLCFPHILLVLLKICLWNIYIFRSQITYAYNQCSFPLLRMVWCYELTKVCRQNTNIETIYVYASELSERAKFFAFSHSKTVISFKILLVLQILCRYKSHACRLTCTDKFPNVPTKFWKSIIGGGGGQLPPCPPLATLVIGSSRTFYIEISSWCEFVRDNHYGKWIINHL